MKKIMTNQAPLPGGHYSQAIEHQGFVFVSGQLPIDPVTGKIIDGDFEIQARQVIRNIAAILEGANSGLHLVVKSTIYIPDIKYWADLNRIYADEFGDHRPARAVIPCRDLHYDVLLEMEVVAATLENEGSS